MTLPRPVSSEPVPSAGALSVLANPYFRRLWLSQLTTQVGANMVLYALTVLVFAASGSSSAVSLLILSFLLPAVLLSAPAGVFVDRWNLRAVLVVTNLARAVLSIGLFLVGADLALILLLNVAISVVSTFFGPAEAAMIPRLVDGEQLIAANGLFSFTLQGSFVIGFAFAGPLLVGVGGAQTVIFVVGLLYVLAALFCFRLPSAAVPTVAGLAAPTSRQLNPFSQLRDGFDYIRANRLVSWSLFYLAVAGSIVGVLGVLGPSFAVTALHLQPANFVVIVLPLALGVVFGVVALNAYGARLPRQRTIEVALFVLGGLVLAIAGAGPVTAWLTSTPIGHFFGASTLLSLLPVVILLAFGAGAAYALVLISSQTALQEEMPEEVRGRVYGVLNMIVSTASLLPIIVAGPLADMVSSPVVVALVGLVVIGAGVASVRWRPRAQVTA